MAEIMDFDPNLNMNGNRSTKIVRMTFGLWTYRKTVEVTAENNMSGFGCMEAAIENYFEHLICNTEIARIILVDESNGDTLECTYDEDKGDNWLSDMLIGIEIVSVEPAASFAELAAS